MKTNGVNLTEQEVENRIIEIRGLKVLLDSDVAALYGVETRVLKQAVRRNEERFPDGHMFKLNKTEFNKLKINKGSQSVISFGGVQYEPFAKLREFSRNISSVIQTSDPQVQKSLLERSSELINDLLDTDGEILESESTIELNLAILKMKRTVKKKTKG